MSGTRPTIDVHFFTNANDRLEGATQVYVRRGLYAWVREGRVVAVTKNQDLIAWGDADIAALTVGDLLTVIVSLRVAQPQAAEVAA